MTAQPSLRLISRTFSSCKTKAPCPWKINSPCLLLPAPYNQCCTFLLYELNYSTCFTAVVWILSVPKSACSKTLVPSLGEFGGGNTRGEAQRDVFRWLWATKHCGVSISFSFSLPGPEASGWLHPVFPPWCAILGLKPPWANYPWTGLPQTISQSKPFHFISWRSQILAMCKQARL